VKQLLEHLLQVGMPPSPMQQKIVGQSRPFEIAVSSSRQVAEAPRAGADFATFRFVCNAMGTIRRGLYILPDFLLSFEL
jgi:hypothetical protein